MEFVRYVVDNLDNIDPDTLESSKLFVYNSIDKYVNYIVPRDEGKIVYNKENYGNYCKQFRAAIKSGLINPDMRNLEIYNKLPNDSLDRWTKLNIIKKLKRAELTPTYKSPLVSHMDNQYIDEIINLSHDVIHELSKIYPIFEAMKKKGLNVNDVLNMIAKESSNETSNEC